jgi:hypothetical protein
MPVSWVKNDDIWKKAEDAVEKTRKKKKEDFTDKDWGLVGHIYKKMGGKKKMKTTEKNEAGKAKVVSTGKTKEPPAHIVDKDKWDTAVTKVISQSRKNQDEFDAKNYAAVTAIYKNLGGTFKKKNERLIQASKMINILNEALS